MKGKKGKKRMKREDLMMVTAAKPTASLFLSAERKKDSTGKSPGVCHKLELAVVGKCICRTGAKTFCTTSVKHRVGSNTHSIPA